MPPPIKGSRRLSNFCTRHLAWVTGTLWLCNFREHDFLLTWRVLNFHSCLAHVLNLAIGDFMGVVTKKGAIANAQAIWDYDPTDQGNRINGGDLDVIATIRTLAVKINVSSQRKEEFEVIQKNEYTNNPTPAQQEARSFKALQLIVHGNTRWGTAHGMMDRALLLQKVRCIQQRTSPSSISTLSSPSTYSSHSPMSGLDHAPSFVVQARTPRRSLGRPSVSASRIGNACSNAARF